MVIVIKCLLLSNFKDPISGQCIIGDLKIVGVACLVQKMLDYLRHILKYGISKTSLISNMVDMWFLLPSKFPFEVAGCFHQSKKVSNSKNIHFCELIVQVEKHEHSFCHFKYQFVMLNWWLGFEFKAKQKKNQFPGKKSVAESSLPCWFPTMNTSRFQTFFFLSPSTRKQQSSHLKPILHPL